MGILRRLLFVPYFGYVQFSLTPSDYFADNEIPPGWFAGKLSMKRGKGVKWEQVRKWVDREGLLTKWRAYGMPEALDPFTSRFADIDPMPAWDIPTKISISAAITGAFFSKRTNPNQPITPDEIRASAEECIQAGAANIHIHVRDDEGFNVLDPERFKAVVAPLRAKYPEVTFDGCLVATNPTEGALLEPTLKMRLFDAVPVNTTAICCGDSMFFKAPHVVIEKARLAQEYGAVVQIAVYDDGDIDNARRFLIDSGVVKKPYNFLILPALPGCSPMHNPSQMVAGLTRMVNLIRDMDREAVIAVCAAGRASTYLATLGILLGLHVRVGMEDTLWLWPHRKDMIQRNADHFTLVKSIAASLGREVMTPAEYRAMLGMPARTIYEAKSA
jgi:3-keto-5-aminohexanoate cleavage enzyme